MKYVGFLLKAIEKKFIFLEAQISLSIDILTDYSSESCAKFCFVWLKIFQSDDLESFVLVLRSFIDASSWGSDFSDHIDIVKIMCRKIKRIFMFQCFFSYIRLSWCLRSLFFKCIFKILFTILNSCQDIILN